MSFMHITGEDFKRVLVASAGLFGDKTPTLGDLKKLVKAVGTDSASDFHAFGAPFVNPGPIPDVSWSQLAARLRTALAETHGQEYADDLWVRIRK